MKRGGQNRKSESWRVNRRGYIVGHVWEGGAKRANIRQHRLIMERHLGRRLERWEDVHHINGKKDDNRIENLQVIEHRQHSIVTNLGLVRRKYKLHLNESQRQLRSEQAKHRGLSGHGRKAIKLMKQEIERLQQINAQLLEALEAALDDLDHTAISNYGEGRYECAGVNGCPACMAEAAIRSAKGETL